MGFNHISQNIRVLHFHKQPSLHGISFSKPLILNLLQYDPNIFTLIYWIPYSLPEEDIISADSNILSTLPYLNYVLIYIVPNRKKKDLIWNLYCPNLYCSNLHWPNLYSPNLHCPKEERSIMYRGRLINDEGCWKNLENTFLLSKASSSL